MLMHLTPTSTSHKHACLYAHPICRVWARENATHDGENLGTVCMNLMNSASLLEQVRREDMTGMESGHVPCPKSGVYRGAKAGRVSYISLLFTTSVGNL